MNSTHRLAEIHKIVDEAYSRLFDDTDFLRTNWQDSLLDSLRCIRDLCTKSELEHNTIEIEGEEL